MVIAHIEGKETLVSLMSIWRDLFEYEYEEICNLLYNQIEIQISGKPDHLERYHKEIHRHEIEFKRLTGPRQTFNL